MEKLLFQSYDMKIYFNKIIKWWLLYNAMDI